MYICKLHIHILSLETICITFAYMFSALIYCLEYLFVAVYMKMHALLHIIESGQSYAQFYAGGVLGDLCM